MLWFILLFVIVASLIEYYFFEGHVELGRWAFRRQPNGTFSRWQIAGQIALIAPPAIGCLAVLAWTLIDFVRSLITA